MGTELTFEKQFIKQDFIIEIPAYQRAYAWGEKEIENFINDLVEIKGKKYYYGHFILEYFQEDEKFEVIDGQQRMTTFVLFLLASKLYLNNDIEQFSDFIKNRFKTIEYDRERFNDLVISILEQNKIVEKSENDTSSFIRILDSLDFFKKIFEKNKIVDATELIDALLNAEISIHKTKDKKVAVQIFELQNSRGVKYLTIKKNT